MLNVHDRVVYCTVGRCDWKEDHNEIATSTDDYLWLKLNHVTFDDVDQGSKDRFTLAQLQIMLLEEFGLYFLLSIHNYALILCDSAEQNKFFYK